MTIRLATQPGTALEILHLHPATAVLFHHEGGQEVRVDHRGGLTGEKVRVDDPQALPVQKVRVNYGIRLGNFTDPPKGRRWKGRLYSSIVEEQSCGPVFAYVGRIEGRHPVLHADSIFIFGDRYKLNAGCVFSD